MTTILHYFYDPLCGWCYGAAPLVRAARALLPVHAHGGGMLAGPHRQALTPQLRAHIRQHDARIAQLTGQPVGPAYLDGRLNALGTVLDSEPPTAAVLAAETLAGRGLDMLARLQTAHYVDGRPVAAHSVLLEIAAALGLDPAAFTGALERESGAAVQAHIQNTRDIMARIGAQGFPTFVLQTGETWQRIDVAPFLARPDDFADHLRGRIAPPSASDAGGSFSCDVGGCTL